MKVDYDIDEFRQRLESGRPRLRSMIKVGAVISAVGLAAAIVYGAAWLMQPWLVVVMIVGFCLGGPLVLEGVRGVRELNRDRPLEVFDDPEQKLVVTLASAPQVPEGAPAPVPFVPRMVAMIVASLMAMQLVLAVVNLIVVIATGQALGNSIFNVGLFAFATYVALWGSWRLMPPRRGVAVGDGRYAFAVDDGTVSFPVSARRGPQHWPLADTSFKVVKGFSGKVLEVTGPDGVRRLPAERLQLPPARIIELVDARRPKNSRPPRR